MPTLAAPVATLREDLALRSHASARGWRESLHVIDVSNERTETPHFNIAFIKGEKHVWFCSRGWACADLTGNGSSLAINYRNHRYHSSLKVAFDKESTD